MYECANKAVHGLSSSVRLLLQPKPCFVSFCPRSPAFAPAALCPLPPLLLLPLTKQAVSMPTSG